MHDAVRPFVTVEQIARVIEEARQMPSRDPRHTRDGTVKEVKRASLPEDVALIIGTIRASASSWRKPRRLFRENC